MKLPIALIAITLIGCSPRAIKYDCNMAEWHPDIPVKVKEECRKLKK